MRDWGNCLADVICAAATQVGPAEYLDLRQTTVRRKLGLSEVPTVELHDVYVVYVQHF